MESRKYLLYIPVSGKNLKSDIFSGVRNYDIAIHDYSGDEYSSFDDVEYQFSGFGHKWGCIHSNLKNISRDYEYYAFFDYDLEFQTEQLNELFEIGQKNNLSLYQASLTLDSYGSYQEFFWHPGFNPLRTVPFVEVMMPIFSHGTLEKLYDSFLLSESGWGIDFFWANNLNANELVVVDSISIKHAEPVVSANWVMKSGLTARGEFEQLLEKGIIIMPDRRARMRRRLLTFVVKRASRTIHYWNRKKSKRK